MQNPQKCSSFAEHGGWCPFGLHLLGHVAFLVNFGRHCFGMQFEFLQWAQLGGAFSHLFLGIVF